jgi:DedD protein
VRNKNKKVSLAKKPFMVLSRRAITGWLVVIFFICAWMFAIGVLVGRGTAPVKFDIAELQRKLAAAGANRKEADQEHPVMAPEIAKDKTELEFYEALKENREDTEIPQITPAPTVSAKIDPPSEKKPPKPPKKSTKKMTQLPPKTEGPAETSKDAPADTSEPKPAAAKSRIETAEKDYTIQVASVKDAGDADRLVAELKKKGFSAYRAIGKVPGKGIWYRVRVGDYQSRDDAGKTLAQLKKAGLKPILVKK